MQHALGDRAEPADEQRERDARNVGRRARGIEQRCEPAPEQRDEAERKRAEHDVCDRRVPRDFGGVVAAAFDDGVLAEAPGRGPARGHADDDGIGHFADLRRVEIARHHERAGDADRAPAHARRDRPQRTASRFACE